MLQPDTITFRFVKLMCTTVRLEIRISIQQHEDRCHTLGILRDDERDVTVGCFDLSLEQHLCP